MTLPADMIGAWRQPADTAQVIPLRPGRHRRAPVRLTRRGKTLILGLLTAAAWTIVGAVGYVVWGLR